MDRIEFLDLSEDELTMVAGGYFKQVNYAHSYQSAYASGSADGGDGNGNHSPTVAIGGHKADAGYNANGNGGSVVASNNNETKQFNIA